MTPHPISIPYGPAPQERLTLVPPSRWERPVGRCAHCQRFLWSTERMVLIGALAYCPECAPRPPEPRFPELPFFFGVFLAAAVVFLLAVLLTMLWLR